MGGVVVVFGVCIVEGVKMGLLPAAHSAWTCLSEGNRLCVRMRGTCDD